MTNIEHLVNFLIYEGKENIVEFLGRQYEIHEGSYIHKINTINSLRDGNDLATLLGYLGVPSREYPEHYNRTLLENIKELCGDL